jgi:hypothetical protein
MVDADFAMQGEYLGELNVNGDLTHGLGRVLPLDSGVLAGIANTARRRPFADLADFRKRSGLDKATIDRIKEFITFE